jgi:hypothetical protein
MKIAAFLALALAIVLGIWTGTDYAHNEHEKQHNIEMMEAEIHRNQITGNTDDSALQESKEIDSAEQYDAILGIVATCALIGAVVLFAKSKAA